MPQNRRDLDCHESVPCRIIKRNRKDILSMNRQNCEELIGFVRISENHFLASKLELPRCKKRGPTISSLTKSCLPYPLRCSAYARLRYGLECKLINHNLHNSQCIVEEDAVNRD